MKASSCGTEVFIYNLSNEEILAVGKNGLEGILNFREVFDDKKKQIPFILKCSKLRDLVEVKLEPEGVYFGEAERIIFRIDKEYYSNLLEEGCAQGARFWLSGKLSLRARDYYQKQLKTSLV